ncbi:MarR family transcriptional regulator [Bacillus thuringiensis]|uniref:Replication protein n=1 Tax=Bacillus thuringiensis subsp. higo TaxID=132266 RepID=A0A9X6LPT7_BACUH|nr:helix-turn-helix domain-containing protein [Bacillus thuringiensis]OUB50125.1 replication protein [Bacillus thuringiensis serovar higo]
MSEAIRKSQEETFIEEWQECYLSEGKKTGYVVTIDLSKDISKQIWYGLNDTKQLLRSSRMSLKDIYLSLNAFVHGSRKTSDLRQIRNIGVDLDFYKLGLSKEYVMKQLEDMVYSGVLPCPNLIMYGRGIQLVYSISGGAAPQMGYMAQYITNNFVKMLMSLGADGACSDLSRVFRLPHSIHSKTGKQITVDLWTKREYSLQELYDYVPPMEKKRPSKRKGTLTTLPAPKGVMTLYSLNTARKADLEKIVELRRGNIENRNDMTYIYAFTTALIVKNQSATVQMTMQLNDKLDDPQPNKEAERTAKRAYKDAISFFDAYAKNDFEMKGLPRGLIKPMKNTTVVDKLNLNLTQDELEQLTTLINQEEKQRRNTSYQKKKRRSKGIKTREEYLGQKEDKLEILRNARKKHPDASVRQLAEITGVTKSTISRLTNLL